MIPFIANKVPTVWRLIFTIILGWFQYYGGMMPPFAYIIATDSLLAFKIFGECLHSYGTSIFYEANIMAIVSPLLF